MRNYKTAIKVLKQIECKLFFDNCADVKIYYNDYYKRYITKKHSLTIRHISGSFHAFREHLNFKHGIGKVLDWVRAGFNLVKYNNYIGIVNVPEDCCIICNHRADVMVIMSHSAGRVLKYESHIFAEQHMLVVSEASKRFCQAGLGKNIPSLYAYGRTKNSESYYTLSEYCPDHLPFFRSYRGRMWPKHLESSIIPVIQEFHDTNGIELLSGPEWSNVLLKKFENKRLPEAMHKSLDLFTQRLSLVEKIIMPMGMIHGDLQPQNVHFSNGCCTLIDWSNTENAALIIDVICDVFFKAMKEPDLESSLEYWHFINGGISLNDCSSSLAALSHVWFRWMHQWQGLMFDESDLRIQLEAACWDWLGSMVHPWQDNNTLWSHIRFPDSFLYDNVTVR